MNTDAGLISEPLFVAMTRPPLRWGVTDSALIVNAMATTELFLFTQNPLTLLIALPLHLLCVLACLHDPRYFDIAFLWLRTRTSTVFDRLHWGCSSYSPLALDLPDARGRRVQHPNVRVANALYATSRTGRGE